MVELQKWFCRINLWEWICEVVFFTFLKINLDFLDKNYFLKSFMILTIYRSMSLCVAKKFGQKNILKISKIFLLLSKS